MGTKVDHDGDICDLASLDAAIDGDPVGCTVMGRLDADDNVFMFGHHGGQGLSIHGGSILFELRATHATTGDVDKSENASFRSINAAMFEVFEILPAAGAGIDDGGDASTRCDGIGHEGCLPGDFLFDPSVCVDVGVDVDQSGSDDQTGGVDGFAAGTGWDGWCDTGDPALGNREVEATVAAIGGINELAVADHQIELAGGGQDRRPKKKWQNEFHQR